MRHHTDQFFARQLELLKDDGWVKEKQAALPASRIKRMMKMDSCEPQPCQIAAPSVTLMALSTQFFIGHVTYLARMLSMEPDKRSTLQVKDLKAALASSNKFDFLVDAVHAFDSWKDEGNNESQSQVAHNDAVKVGRPEDFLNDGVDPESLDIAAQMMDHGVDPLSPWADWEGSDDLLSLFSESDYESSEAGSFKKKRPC